MTYEEECADLMAKASAAMAQNNIQLANDYMDKVDKLDAKHQAELDAQARIDAAQASASPVVPVVDPQAQAIAEANAAALAEPTPVALAAQSVNLMNATEGGTFMPELNQTQTREEIIASAEYRTAYFMNLKGMATPEQVQMLDTGAGSAGAAVPQITANRIQEALGKVAGVIGKVDLKDIPGCLRWPYESTFNQASLHTENASIDGSADVISYLALPTYEITKLLPLSANLDECSIDALENWVVNSVYRGVLYKSDNYIINGSGSSQPAGIESLTFVDTTNAVAWAGAALAYADLVEAISYLPAIYDRTACFVMNKKTYWQNVRGLALGSTYDSVIEGGLLLGYPVVFDDFVSNGVIYFGSIEDGIVVNVPGGIRVENDKHLRTNSHDFLGAANFSCNVVPNAWIKIAASLS